MDTRVIRRRALWRRVAAVILGAGTAVIIAPLLGIPAGLLAGWGVLLLVSTTMVLVEVWPMTGEQTREHARIEDPGRRYARLTASVGSIVSLGAVIVVIVQARNADGGEAVAFACIALVSVVASWAAIQSNYMLHYAKTYYEDDGAGKLKRGIDFNQHEDPCYTDFAYFSVGLGMTYQISDTNLSRNELRRIVIAQTLLAYLFGAGILATVINLVAGLG